jgi:hypothetical protein
VNYKNWLFEYHFIAAAGRGLEVALRPRDFLHTGRYQRCLRYAAECHASGKKPDWMPRLAFWATAGNDFPMP